MKIKEEYQCGCLLNGTETLDTVCYMVERSIVETSKINGICPKATVLAAARVLGSMITDALNQNKEIDVADYKTMIIAQIDMGMLYAEKCIQAGDGQSVDN